MVADTAAARAGCAGSTPLGWAEEMRPFAGARPLVLLLPLVATAVLLVVAGGSPPRRDVGTGLLAGPRHAPTADLRLLSSPTAQALRGRARRS